MSHFDSYITFIQFLADLPHGRLRRCPFILQREIVMGDEVMALIAEFACEPPNGVHAHPASHIETQCNTFISHIEWHNLRTECKGSARSVLLLIGTDTLAGNSRQLLISGANEQAAHQYLSQWLRNEFLHCNAPPAEVRNNELEPLPASLAHLNSQFFRTRTVYSGSTGGVLSLLSSLDLNALSNLPSAQDIETE